MDTAELDALALEILDPDLPNAVKYSFGNGPDLDGTLSTQYIETDEIAGDRSVLTGRKTDLASLAANAAITVDGEAFFARVIQSRGRALSAVVLGK